MRRVAFKMKLFKGCCEEYKKRHDAIWPELCRELKAAGISDYSIFLDEETLTLFAVQKLTDANSADSLPEKEIMKNGGITWRTSWRPSRINRRSVLNSGKSST